MIREIKPHEIPFLREMMYQAIFIPEGKERPERTILAEPEIKQYIVGFGREGDKCFVALDNETLIGAIWVRYFSEAQKAYGFVSEEYPELVIAIDEKYRGKGIGTSLLSKMLDYFEKAGLPGISLSVDIINPARKLYLKFGFVDVEIEKGTAIMLWKNK